MVNARLILALPRKQRPIQAHIITTLSSVDALGQTALGHGYGDPGLQDTPLGYGTCHHNAPNGAFGPQHGAAHGHLARHQGAPQLGSQAALHGYPGAHLGALGAPHRHLGPHHGAPHLGNQGAPHAAHRDGSQGAPEASQPGGQDLPGGSGPHHGAPSGTLPATAKRSTPRLLVPRNPASDSASQQAPSGIVVASSSQPFAGVTSVSSGSASTTTGTASPSIATETLRSSYSRPQTSATAVTEAAIPAPTPPIQPQTDDAAAAAETSNSPQLPEDDTFKTVMSEMLNVFGPRPTSDKKADMDARACWIRDLIVWQVRMMAIDFDKPETFCRRLIVPGTGSVDIRIPSVLNQWREWRVDTKQEPPRQPGQTKAEHTKAMYERWNSFAPLADKTAVLSDEKRAELQREKDKDLRAMAAWRAHKIQKQDRVRARTAMDHLNEKLAALATVANDLHGMSLIAFVAHPNGAIRPAYTGTIHAREVFKTAVSRIQDGRYDLNSIATAFWCHTVAAPPIDYLRPSAQLVSLANSLAFVTRDDVAVDTDETWAIIRSVICEHLFHIMDEAVSLFGQRTTLSLEQRQAEQDWVRMSKSCTKLPYQDVFTVLKRIGLKVTGWPAIGRALLDREKIDFDKYRIDADPPTPAAAQTAVPVIDSTTATPRPTPASTYRPTPLQEYANAPTALKRPKGRKTEAELANFVKRQQQEAPFALTVRSGTLCYSSHWPRYEGRAVFFALHANNDLIKVVPIEDAEDLPAEEEASPTTSTALLSSPQALVSPNPQQPPSGRPASDSGSPMSPPGHTDAEEEILDEDLPNPALIMPHPASGLFIPQRAAAASRTKRSRTEMEGGWIEVDEDGDEEFSEDSSASESDDANEGQPPTSRRRIGSHGRGRGRERRTGAGRRGGRGDRGAAPTSSHWTRPVRQEGDAEPDDGAASTPILSPADEQARQQRADAIRAARTATSRARAAALRAAQAAAEAGSRGLPELGPDSVLPSLQAGDPTAAAEGFGDRTGAQPSGTDYEAGLLNSMI
ncbi:hypothetical protein OC844_005285 [Tilletia horrida]|nr:hypothetical protein OC844_005285 [Tilletia horrida]